LESNLKKRGGLKMLAIEIITGVFKKREGEIKMKEVHVYMCRECFEIFEVIGGDQDIEICDCGELADRIDDLLKK
jgi:hypothetical protein